MLFRAHVAVSLGVWVLLFGVFALVMRRPMTPGEIAFSLLGCIGGGVLIDVDHCNLVHPVGEKSRCLSFLAGCAYRNVWPERVEYPIVRGMFHTVMFGVFVAGFAFAWLAHMFADYGFKFFR